MTAISSSPRCSNSRGFALSTCGSKDAGKKRPSWLRCSPQEWVPLSPVWAPGQDRTGHGAPALARRPGLRPYPLVAPRPSRDPLSDPRPARRGGSLVGPFGPGQLPLRISGAEVLPVDAAGGGRAPAGSGPIDAVRSVLHRACRRKPWSAQLEKGCVGQGGGVCESSAYTGRARKEASTASRRVCGTQFRSYVRNRGACDALIYAATPTSTSVCIHGGAFNLGLVMRKLIGRGTPRGLHGLISAFGVFGARINSIFSRIVGYLRLLGGPFRAASV